MTDLMMQISPHFKLYELVKSETADRLGIDNTPPAAMVPKLTRLAGHLLEPVRNKFGIPFSPNSGYRCLKLNRALGSKDTSQHVKGEAVDIELPGVPNGDLARWIEGNLDFDQLILEFYTPGKPTSGWVHVSLADADNRGDVLTIGKTVGGQPFTTIGIFT